LLTVKLRYKEPTADRSEFQSFPVLATDRALSDTSTDFRFAAAVACFCLVLRESEHRGDADLGLALAQVREFGFIFGIFCQENARKSNDDRVGSVGRLCSEDLVY
jgi:hypothetical protein